MKHITSSTVADLFDVAGTRRLEQRAAADLPAHALMQRAGLAVARLAMAIAPRARTIWIACGPGNNGGDGLEAAFQLQTRGHTPVVTHIGEEARLPADALASLRRARDAGVRFAAQPPAQCDLAIDALLGIGATRPPEGLMRDWLQRMHAQAPIVLSLDLPSGLNADTGTLAFDFLGSAIQPRPHTRRVCLTLLTLKPGLFTAQGRDAVGELWFDDLGVESRGEPPAARLPGPPIDQTRLHASHKGRYGDVAVIGGAPGMAGAALLAASAALAAGAGRVYLSALDPGFAALDPLHPELMLRRSDTLDLATMAVVCGCGGGTAIRARLPRVLRDAHSLVLDADALNAVAESAELQALLRARAERGQASILTPHPLEAARLLGSTTTAVQGDRLGAARRLAEQLDAAVVLKGSGTVITDAAQPPIINPSGNGRLATAGTGDVLAGMIGAALASGRSTIAAASEAVWRHGNLADRWPAEIPLTAGALARGLPHSLG